MREYVEKTLHTRVDCEPVDASGLPLYLRGLYSLERWTAFGVPFAVASPVESPTAKTMAKHRDALEAALGTPVAFALEGATAYRVGCVLSSSRRQNRRYDFDTFSVLRADRLSYF